MSTGADRDRLRAQLAGHLERLRHEGVWGLSIPEAAETESLQPVEAEAPETVEAGGVQAVEAETLELVGAEASGCVVCRLHETRTKVVFGVGNPDARLMFIGEAIPFSSHCAPEAAPGMMRRWSSAR